MTRTLYLEGSISPEVATNFYHYLLNNVVWEEGVRSKKGFTRYAKPLAPGDDPNVDLLVKSVLDQMEEKYHVRALYLNYYPSHKNFTPNHSHPGSVQLVISLGGTRTLTVGKKAFRMKNGDSALFGSAIHGVPAEEPGLEEEGRISIATFMTKIES